MSRDTRSTEEQWLAERLRGEAMQSRPDFSESLHDRITLELERRRNARAVRLRVRETRHRGRLVAVVAACLVGVVMIGLRLQTIARQSLTGDESAVGAMSLVDELVVMDGLAEQATSMFVATAVRPPAADFEHDMRLAAAVLCEGLPLGVETAIEP